MTKPPTKATVPSFIPPVPEYEPGEERAYALFCASLFFGLSCMAEGSIPPRTTTVVEGAKMFEDFLIKKDVADG